MSCHKTRCQTHWRKYCEKRNYNPIISECANIRYYANEAKYLRYFDSVHYIDDSNIHLIGLGEEHVSKNAKRRRRLEDYAEKSGYNAIVASKMLRTCYWRADDVDSSDESETESDIAMIDDRSESELTEYESSSDADETDGYSSEDSV